MSQQASSDSGKGSARGLFSGNIGFILAVAGSAVGLGNIWRFPYLAAKYGGGIFLLVYLILMLTFGYALIVAETSLGRKTRLSPVGAYRAFGQMKRNPFLVFGGWINAVVPMLILPYYCLIGGWIIKYLFEYVVGDVTLVAGDGYFGSFISSPFEPIIWNLIFLGCTLGIILKGVEGGVERASRVMMPLLLILAVIVAVYSMTRPGAGAGIYYYLVPDFSKFSIMTVVAACGQLFFSLSIGMGILITYGSYMKKEVNVDQATYSIGLMDTLVAVLAGFMIIPAVFAFSGGDEAALNQGKGLMFVTLPKVFADAGILGLIFGGVFFLLVLFAALTSSVSLMETVVSIFQDKFHWSRKKTCALVMAGCFLLAVPSSLGYGALSWVTVAGLAVLDMFDFLTNSVMMPIVAFCTCLFVGYVVKTKTLVNEVKRSSPFKREKLFVVMIRYVAPVCIVLILVSSILDALGIVKI